MSIQHKSLLAASNILDPDHQYEISAAGVALNGGLGRVAVPLSITPIPVHQDVSNVAVNDFFGTTETHVFGDGENLFSDNGSGEDSGSEFQVTEVNGNAAYVGIPITTISGAIIIVNADGTFSYDPNGQYEALAGPDSGSANRSGTDSFTYSITGGSTATVFFTITGVDNNDVVDGSSDDDHLFGGVGDDYITGYGGNDHIDGGSGNNIAVYSGSRSDYIVDYDSSTRTFTITDFRDEPVDGTDTVTNVQTFQFTNDGTSETFTFDEAGGIIKDQLNYDLGGDLINEYDPGNIHPWGSIRTIHGSDGTLQSQEVFMDGGDRWLTTFGPGTWTNAHYSVNDELMSITTTFGDGTHALTIYDFDDSHNWSSVAITYDANWNVTQTDVTGDDIGGPGHDPQRTAFTDVVGGVDQADWYSTPFDPNLGAAHDDVISSTGRGDAILYGYAGDDTITGGFGNDLIVGGRGDDTMTGGGGNDHFVFSVGDGHDTITDFRPGDTIDFRNYDVTNFDDLLAHAIETDSDVIITFDVNNQVILHNVSLDQLDSGQFTFGVATV